MARRPVEGTISQGYGKSQFSYLRFGVTENGGYFHNGWDIAPPCGSPVVAPENGTAYQQWEPGGYGYYIKFVGDSGWTHDLGHMQGNFTTPNGGHVGEGTRIGSVGSTGNSTGCHTHWSPKAPGYSSRDGRLGVSDPAIFLQGGNLPYSDAQYNQVVAEREDLRNLLNRDHGWVANLLYWYVFGRGVDAEGAKNLKDVRTDPQAILGALLRSPEYASTLKAKGYSDSQIGGYIKAQASIPVILAGKLGQTALTKEAVIGYIESNLK